MSGQWIVMQTSGDTPKNWFCYGPFGDEQTARNFAEFVTEEIDPAGVFELHSPVSELLSWRTTQKESL